MENKHRWVDKVNGYGVLFRFLTPAFLAIIGTLILGNLGSLKEDMKELKNGFANHLEHHRQTEVVLADKLGRIETLLKK